jgi:hypothetical protein
MAKKPTGKVKLHKHIATGGKPSTFKGAIPGAVVNPKKK